MVPSAIRTARNIEIPSPPPNLLKGEDFFSFSCDPLQSGPHRKNTDRDNSFSLYVADPELDSGAGGIQGGG